MTPLTDLLLLFFKKTVFKVYSHNLVNKMKFFLCLFVSFLCVNLFVVGCIQKEVVYVCPDGSTKEEKTEPCPVKLTDIVHFISNDSSLGLVRQCTPRDTWVLGNCIEKCSEEGYKVEIGCCGTGWVSYENETYSCSHLPKK